MRMSDIKDKYFVHLIGHAKDLINLVNDLDKFHGVSTSKEIKGVFPSESELQSMRINDIELTDKQWNEFNKIIEEAEVNIARSIVQEAILNAEDKALQRDFPIQYDQHGYAYRMFRDYDGRPYRSYIEMGV